MYQCRDCAKSFDETDLDNDRILCDECNGQLELIVPGSKDEDLSREYVETTFLVSREVCHEITKLLTMLGKVKIDCSENNDNLLEISLSILGTTFAVLKEYSKIMTNERGALIEKYCKFSIASDYDLPKNETLIIFKIIDNYQDCFKTGIINKTNPFGEITKLMISRCLGSEVSKICLPEPDADIFSPVIIDSLTDIMMITVTKTMEFWKNK